MAVQASDHADNAATDFDAAGFRRALGSFATGVTIITTRAEDGLPLGLTVNSFNSVSLNPPLVLWSLASSSKNLQAFRKAGHWAVHILAADQEALSGRFARAGTDKFADIVIDEGIEGLPLLQNCTARFQCRTAFQYDGGDHVIFVGEVLDFDWTETAPLVFHRGRYAHATRRESPDVLPSSTEFAGSLGEDFLGYQLGRAHFRFLARIRPLLRQEQLSDEQFFVLSTLTLKGSINDEDSGQALKHLEARGFIRSTSKRGTGLAAYELTESGAACAVRVITAARALEAEVLDQLDPADAPTLRLLLSRLLAAIDPDSTKV